MATSEPDVTARSFVNALLPYTTTILCVDNSLFSLSYYVLCFVIVSWFSGKNLSDMMCVFQFRCNFDLEVTSNQEEFGKMLQNLRKSSCKVLAVFVRF
jgi:hypothetical protein